MQLPVLNKIIKSNYLPSLDPSPAHRLSGAHLHLSPLSAHGLATMSGWGKHRSPRFHEARSSIQLWQRPSCGRAYGCGSRNGNPSSLSSTLDDTALSSPHTPLALLCRLLPVHCLRRRNRLKPLPPASCELPLVEIDTMQDRGGESERITISFISYENATAGICYYLLS